MRILYLTEESISFDEPLTRGGAIHVRNVVQGLRNRGHSVHVLDWNTDPSGDFKDSVDPFTRFIDGPTRTLIRAVEVGRAQRPDTIISKTRKTYLPGLLAARALGIPHIVHVGSLPEPVRPGLFPYLDNLSFTTRLRLPHDGYLVVCNAIRESLEARGVSAKPIHMVKNAVDLERFSTTSAVDLREELSNISPDRPVVGFIGGLYSYKGVHDLVEAVALAKVDLQVVFAGDGPERSVLEERLDDRGTFLGVVPYESIPAVYSAVDVLVLPSHTEGLPRVILEAQAMETPVVATAVGGVPEVIEDGVSGILCHPQDPACIAEAIEELVTDNEFRTRLARRGREQVEEGYSWERLYDRYETALDDIVV